MARDPRKPVVTCMKEGGGEGGRVLEKEKEAILEGITSRGRKEERNGTWVMRALRSILHGWLAQRNDILVWFGFGTRAVLNKLWRESLGLTVMAFPRGTGVWLPVLCLPLSSRNHSGDNQTEDFMQMYCFWGLMLNVGEKNLRCCEGIQLIYVQIF